MTALDALVVTTALGTIRQDFDASIEALEWTVNAYTLSLAVLLMTGAAFGDRFGRRRMFAAGLTLFVAASVACALAGNVVWLIAARAVQGAGAALVMPLGMALLSAAYPREERGKALGIFGSITGLALIAGPVIGGAVADGLAWQWIFLDQPSDRPRHRSAGASSHSREPWDGWPVRRRRSHPRDSRGACNRVGADARQSCRLDEPGNHRGSACRHRPFRGLRRLGAARRRADGADALFSSARLFVGRRRELAVLCGDVRHPVPAAAVLSDSTGIEPSRRWIAAAAVDRDFVYLCADRR
jgi:hypothetical protein